MSPWRNRTATPFTTEKRPATGIWAGLYCPPVFADEPALLAALPAPARSRVQALEPVAHSLTHRELRLHPKREGELVHLNEAGIYLRQGIEVAHHQVPVVG